MINVGIIGCGFVGGAVPNLNESLSVNSQLPTDSKPSTLNSKLSTDSKL